MCEPGFTFFVFIFPFTIKIQNAFSKISNCSCSRYVYLGAQREIRTQLDPDTLQDYSVNCFFKDLSMLNRYSELKMTRNEPRLKKNV